VAVNLAEIVGGKASDWRTGGGEVVQGRAPLAVSIHNPADRPFTYGIAQLVGSSSGPVCAFPLHGNGLDVIAPGEEVLLAFSPSA
jgi:hypothetical protein